jgi:hypothetical protein
MVVDFPVKILMRVDVPSALMEEGNGLSGAMPMQALPGRAGLTILGGSLLTWREK